MQALQPFETSINIYYYAQYNIPEHLHFQLYMRLSSGEVNLLHDNNISFSNALSVAYAIWHGDFSLLQNSNTGSGAHPASYWKGNAGAFFGFTTTDAWWALIPI